jgi:hypothetical protein
METVLRGLAYESCLVYLNDVIVINRTFQEHLLNLRKVFQRLREARLKLNPEKCQLFRRKYGTPSIFGRLGGQSPTPRRSKPYGN